MKTKILTLILLTGLTTHNLRAEPVITDPMKTQLWQQKNMSKAPKKIILKYFNIIYKTTTVISEGSLTDASKNYVGTRTHLDLTPELALKITDEAYTYFKSAFEAKGYEIIVFEEEKIKNHKKFKDAVKKGKGASTFNGVANPMTEEEGVGDGAQIFTCASNVNHFWMGAGISHNEYEKVAKDITKKINAAGMSVTGLIDFVDPKTGKEAGAGWGKIAVSAAPSIRFFNDNRYGAPNAGYGEGMVTFQHGSVKGRGDKFNVMGILDADQSWVASVDREDQGNFIIDKYTMNKEEYKRIAVGVLKVYVDNLIEKYEESFYGK